MDKFELPVIQEQSGCGCGAARAESENPVPDLNQSFVSGSIDTPAGRTAASIFGAHLGGSLGFHKNALGCGRE